MSFVRVNGVDGDAGIPSGAKAPMIRLTLSARLKSCPFKAECWKDNFSGIPPLPQKARQGWGTRVCFKTESKAGPSLRSG